VVNLASIEVIQNLKRKLERVDQEKSKLAGATKRRGRKAAAKPKQEQAKQT